MPTLGFSLSPSASSASAAAVFGGIPIPTVSDPDAQLYVNAVYNAGKTLTLTERTELNTLVIGLKGGNNPWSKITHAYPMLGSDAAAFSINLKAPGTNNLVFTGSSNGYGANGFTVGTGGSASTGLNANTLLNSDHSFGIYNSQSPSSNSFLIGAGSLHYIRDQNTGSITYQVQNGSSSATPPGANPRIGFHAVTSSSGSVGYWKNGLQQGGNSAASPFATGIFRVGAFSDSYGNANGHAVGAIISFAYIGLLMSSNQLSEFNSDLQTFQSNLSRSVAP